MRSISRYLALALVASFVILQIAIGGSVATPVSSYTVTNLVADTAGAKKKDPLMINAWGMASLGGNDPFWINDEGSGVSELIDGAGNILSSLPSVTVPVPAGASAPSGPTGIVANSTKGFALAKGGPASFIFDTIGGTIAAWNTSMGKQAVIVVNNSAKAVYTGLAMATNGGSPFLYAANALGSVDVFDSTFAPVTTAGGFADPNLPSGLTPYGIANIGGTLFVTYAQRFQPTGAVDEFDLDGNLITRFATDGTLNAPWAVTTAPANFGAFSNDLLVGNFGDGSISAFNPKTGEPLGQLTTSDGKTLQIPGLWALVPGAGVKGVSNPNAIYFTAGPNGELNGVFGFIAANKVIPTPKPSPTKRPTPTPRPRPTPRPTSKPTPTKRPTPGKSPTPTPSPSPTPTPIPSPSPSPISSPTPTSSPQSGGGGGGYGY